MMKKLFMVLAMALLVIAPLASATYHPPKPMCPKGTFEAGENNAVAYANSVVSQSGVSDAHKALGVDDNKHARINEGGYLVLDMGEGEEIIDRVGVDMIVYGDHPSELVHIYVSNSPNSGFQYADSLWSTGDQTAEIDLTSYTQARYVKIVVPAQTGRVSAEIDAVRTKCLPEQTTDVPEFGVIAAIGVLAIAGVFIAKKRN